MGSELVSTPDAARLKGVERWPLFSPRAGEKLPGGKAGPSSESSTHGVFASAVTYESTCIKTGDPPPARPDGEGGEMRRI